LNDAVLRTLLEAVAADPGDPTVWLALADALEEHRETNRAELTRLSLRLRRLPDDPERPYIEGRLRELLALGARTCSPTVRLSIGMELILLAPGSFNLGSPEDEGQRSADEGPVQRVTITEAFFLGVYPVTQAEWDAVMEENPSTFRGPRRPVEGVSWGECVEFCARLSRLEGRRFRLPTETEWEYACRAGTSTPFYFGDTISTDLANFDGTNEHPYSNRGIYRRETTDVGEFPPNAFGLYDMHGNVWEWCSDWYRSNSTRATLAEEDGTSHIIRGGSWFVPPRRCRSAYRDSAALDFRRDDNGCRVVMER
jgi:eukaryotic-like serine/threonine-protein kinase